MSRLRRFGGDGRHTLLALQPLTGRTHQLRVHLAWIGHPILGDHLYGKPESLEQRWPRFALHCHRIVVDGVTITGAAAAGVPLSVRDIHPRAAANPAAAAAGLRVNASNAAPAIEPRHPAAQLRAVRFSADRARHGVFAVVAQQAV